MGKSYKRCMCLKQYAYKYSRIIHILVCDSRYMFSLFNEGITVASHCVIFGMQTANMNKDHRKCRTLCVIVAEGVLVKLLTA